jgi:hypothetical protein
MDLSDIDTRPHTFAQTATLLLEAEITAATKAAANGELSSLHWTKIHAAIDYLKESVADVQNMITRLEYEQRMAELEGSA